MVSYLDVATIESTSHLDGRLSLASRGGLSVLLEEGTEVHLVPPKIDVIRSAHIASVQDEGRYKSIVRFREVGSRDIAEQLVGMHCLVDKEVLGDVADILDLSIDDGFKGWKLFDETSGRSGTINCSWSASGNLLGEVVLDDEFEGASAHIVPLADDLIVDADKEALLLTVALPNGIFEL